jgi:chromosome segregation ATPase
MMHKQTICDYCGHSYVAHRRDQRFCCSSHNTMFYQKQKRDVTKAKIEAALQSSSDLDQLRQENERLRTENDQLKEQKEQWKNSIIKHNERIGRLEEIIDKRDDTIKEREKEIERLKLEKRLFNQTSVKNAATLTREHLERVLTSEIRRQFPSDPHIQEHIGAIRSFNASYINALVTE